MQCSGEHEKLQMAAMMASVGAVSERPLEVFVSMNAMSRVSAYLAFLLAFGEKLHQGAAPEQAMRGLIKSVCAGRVHFWPLNGLSSRNEYCEQL